MRVLLVAPDVSGGAGERGLGGYLPLDTIPEIRSITGMHRVTVLNGKVTAQDLDAACRGNAYDIIHFATHSNEQIVQLSAPAGGPPETLDADDIIRLARLCSCRLIFFNSCLSARLAAYAVAHGVPYAIATTIALSDREAWKTPLAFYEYLKEQMQAVHDPAAVNIPAAFEQAANGDGTYALLQARRQPSETAAVVAEIRREVRRLYLTGAAMLAGGMLTDALIIIYLLRHTWG